MEPVSPLELLRKHRLRPDKRLGQHFLVDMAVARREVELADIQKSETVLEIGPGLGTLTLLLAERARRVVAYEASGDMCRALEPMLPGNVELIQQDFLEADVGSVDKVVSNIPYNISSPLTFKLFEVGFRRGVLMYQLEFAERLAAPPGSGDYSRLSVKAYMKARVELLERVPASAFHPPPKVDSAIVAITPRPPPFQPAVPELFDALVDALFAHRRKKIASTVKLEHARLDLPEPKSGLDLSRLPHGQERVESLSAEQIEEVAAHLAALRK